MDGVIGTKPSDLIALGAYSRILSDDDVGRTPADIAAELPVAPAAEGGSVSPSRLSLSMDWSVVAPPRATIASFKRTVAQESEHEG